MPRVLSRRRARGVPQGSSLGVFLICWLPWYLPTAWRISERKGKRERQVEPPERTSGGVGRARWGWQRVDWVTAHYVISTGSELTSRLNCAGDNGNLPGHSTVSPHGIFNVVAAPHFTFYNSLSAYHLILSSRSRLGHTIFPRVIPEREKE